MSIAPRISPARLLILTAVYAATGLLHAQDAGWPRVVQDGGNEVVIYQPQPDSIDGVTLQSRVAVSIKRPVDQEPVFGALWVTATLSVDRDQDIAHVIGVKIDRTRFTDIPESDVKSLTQFLEADVPRWDLSISLTRLRASLQPAELGPEADYRNDPPKIVVENRPAILLLLDGQPKLQAIGQSGLQRVANTAMPVIFDSKNKEYWLYGSSIWFTTRDLLHGEWKASDKAPSQIADLVKDKDTLEEAQSDAGKAASAAQLRTAKIVVATEPTELIVTEGAPKYSPLLGGELLYVANSDSDIFLEVATQRTFVLISGRWFAARSMQGPWTFVAPDALPKAFANVPENSPKANVLAFVPGTDRAKDALMDNVIPQTAEVSRRDATKVDVQYDGAPKFAPIPDTSLAYAENTPSQVIRADGKYFACDEGVWYSAPSPTGPWAVSDVRPTGVDKIPPSSPVYNTKFVYIYDSTPEVVYVGYLPGYRWSFPYRGVVVYGTGWYYGGWYGSYYYPRPTTWGFSVRYNSWSGWSFGMSWTSGWLGISSGWGYGWAGWGPAYGPGFWSRSYAGGWFGPGGYRPPYRPNGFRPRPYRPNGFGPRPHWGASNNIYNRPGSKGIRQRPPMYPDRRQSGGNRRSGGPLVTRPDTRRSNNVYTDRDGNVHRNSGDGWQKRQDRKWKPENTPSVPARPAQKERPKVAPTPRTEPRGGGSPEGERRARERGSSMTGPSRPSGAPAGRRR
jgi:hypothetical protein